MTTNQASLSNAVALITTLAFKRNTLCIIADGDCFVGGSAVTVNTGLLVKANIPYYLDVGDLPYLSTTGSLYGITSGASVVIYFAEMNFQG